MAGPLPCRSGGRVRAYGPAGKRSAVRGTCADIRHPVFVGRLDTSPVAVVSHADRVRLQNGRCGGTRLTRAAAGAPTPRGRRGWWRATSWRSARAGRGRVGGRCARRWPAPAGVRRQTGGGWPVRVRRKEGVTNHLHPESCARRREAAGEALTGARMGRAIEHRKRACLERRDCPSGRRPHRHHRDG